MSIGRYYVQLLLDQYTRKLTSGASGKNNGSRHQKLSKSLCSCKAFMCWLRWIDRSKKKEEKKIIRIMYNRTDDKI